MAIGPVAAERIDAGGGTLTSVDGRIQVAMPPGASPAPGEYSVQELTNMAPGGVGSAYRLGPDGATFSIPVTVTLHADLVNQSLDDLAVAYQDGSGYWIRVPNASRDPDARTLTVTTLHFSDWALVTGASPRDLSGSFTITSTMAIPFTVDGSAMLGYAGENAVESFYLLGGTEAPRAPITLGAVTCTPDAPTLPLFTNIAELKKSPLDFQWGTSGHWNLTCSDSSTQLLTYSFDTLGMAYFGCSRGYVGPQTLGPDRLVGKYVIDCGVKGTLTGTWSLQSATCGQACPPSNPCRTATWVCATGAAVCTDTGFVADGTSCGTDLVCNGGSCTSCASGVACSTQPDPLCHAGITSCATGTSQCVNGAALPNGTSCGTDLVCNGGACTSCASGLACSSQPDPLCHAGVTSCATGASQCVNGAALPNGTSCGTNLVCNAGACVACTAGASCTTQPDPLCHAGITSCSTGAPVCENGAALANGTTCGTGQSCNVGGCVASRTVTGTRLVTYWPDTGAPLAPVPAPDVNVPPLATVAALVPRAGGGFETYAGTIGAAGDVSIPNVPQGTYILSFVDGAGAHTFLETSASTVDLGYDVLGRAGTSVATASTPVTFDLSGVTAWTAGDEIQIASSNGDVFDVPTRNATIAAGATAISVVDDWSASALGPALNLLDPSDVLWVHDLATLTTTRIADPTLYPYLAATGAASVTGLAFTSGAPSSVTATLTAAPRTGYVTGDALTGIDWRLDDFEAQLPSMTGLSAMPAGSVHTLSVCAAARALANPAPMAVGNPVLFRLQLPHGTGDFVTASGLSYGAFLEPELWLEWRGVELSVPIAYTLAPATDPFTDHAVIGRREAMPAPPALSPSPIVPTLLPVQSPMVNGSGAFATLIGVTTTPTLSWSAPPAPSAAPTSYTVEIVRLVASGASTQATSVARWRVASTSIAVPADLLAAGGTYYARITATSSSPDPLLTKPLSGEYATAFAATLTGTFSP